MHGYKPTLRTASQAAIVIMLWELVGIPDTVKIAPSVSLNEQRVMRESLQQAGINITQQVLSEPAHVPLNPTNASNP